MKGTDYFKKRLGEELAGRGFTWESKRWVRESGGIRHYVDVQASKWSGGTRYINWGVSLASLPEPYGAHVYGRLNRGDGAQLVYELADASPTMIDEAVSEIASLLDSTLRRFTSPSELQAYVRSEKWDALVDVTIQRHFLPQTQE